MYYGQEREVYKYLLCRSRRPPSSTIKEKKCQERKKGKGKNAEGKMRLIKIKNMHLPLSAQPRRTTIDDVIRWESSGEVKG
jgi:hypothetical protein